MMKRIAVALALILALGACGKSTAQQEADLQKSIDAGPTVPDTTPMTTDPNPILASPAEKTFMQLANQREPGATNGDLLGFGYEACALHQIWGPDPEGIPAPTWQHVVGKYPSINNAQRIFDLAVPALCNPGG